jgi:hypothetical protein
LPESIEGSTSIFFAHPWALVEDVHVERAGLAVFDGDLDSAPFGAGIEGVG